jgi:LuxR family maltose regulon positive regulatory protein
VKAGADTAIVGEQLHADLARAQLLADDVDAARATLTAAPICSATPQIVVGLGVSARVAARGGSLTDATEYAQRSLAASDAFGIRDHMVTLDARLAWCGALIDRNEIAQTAEVLGDLREVLGRYPSFVYETLTSLEAARIAAAREGAGAALEQLRALRRVVEERDRPLLRSHVDALEARMRLELGESRTAKLLVERLPETSAARRLLAVRLLLADGQAGAAREELAALDFTNPRDEVAAQVLSLRASVIEGDDVDGELRRLLELAAPERFVRAVLDEGPVIARLVRRCAEASDAVEAQRFAIELGAPGRRREAAEPGLIVVPLSARERDVLRFLPSRLTTKEIASECFMSVNTVKAHLKKIYSKLGVTTRAEAVERAGMLGELPTRNAHSG